ncbi:uncharacterized protein LOC143219509 [Lasioglossum baleicum]|uniref:uncharacterized protein LOC143207931 n=1 Tax=Lasioglossum baleicum TaxID=434251 RepID=UPI003FCDC872
MEKIAGKVKGSFVFVHNDYVYNKDHRSENIYRCNTRRTTRCCGAVMVLSDGTITLLKPHNHPGQEYIATQHFMIEEMMKLSRETLIPFKQIFDDVCRKHPDAAAYCSFSKLRPTLHRQRANFKPTIPQSLEILYDQMKTYLS